MKSLISMKIIIFPNHIPFLGILSEGLPNLVFQESIVKYFDVFDSKPPFLSGFRTFSLKIYGIL